MFHYSRSFTQYYEVPSLVADSIPSSRDKSRSGVSLHDVMFNHGSRWSLEGSSTVD